MLLYSTRAYPRAYNIMESAFNTEAPIQGQANNEEHFPSSRDVRLPHLAFHR